jgi:hypothetical protein
MLIGELDSSTLIDDIDGFATDLRQSIRSAPSNGVVRGAPIRGSLAARLQKYFDEFSGHSNLKGRKQSVADCYHGTVVRAIRNHFDGCAQIFKNEEVDLIVVTKKLILLFEVKTSAHTQSVYTAVGQLSVHASGVAKYDPKVPLIKVIVLPEQPTTRLRHVLTQELGIRLITFTRSATGRIAVDGLRGLVADTDGGVARERPSRRAKSGGGEPVHA